MNEVGGEAPAPERTNRRSAWRTTAVRGSVLLGGVGLVLTALVTWAAYQANENSNQSLLRLEVRQVASSLTTALSSVQSGLSDAVNEATSTNSPAAFKAFVASAVGPTGFASESLWQRTPSGVELVATVGSQTQLVRDGDAASFLSHLRPRDELQVTGLLPGNPPRLGYAELPPSETRYIVYAESVLPAHRKLTVPPSSPFGQLNYALYLGPGMKASDLLATSVPVPIGGLHDHVSVPFGDTVLTVVATPRTQLSSALSGDLPWIALGVGAVLSVLGAVMFEYVAWRRRHAEELAGKLRELHARQRSIARTLQHALLPESIPSVPGLDLAARYLPSVEDMQVGGDWYDLVPLDGDRLVFVIGDVSGRGVRAAAVMASLRFAAQGFALEGHEPSAILERLRPMLDFDRDGSFATVLCGLIDVGHHRLVVASAGHPPPVLSGGGGSAALRVAPSPPIGMPGPVPVTTTVEVAASATLVAYTDGLVERRGEALDVGIERLARSVDGGSGSLDELLGTIVKELTMNVPDDDVALIGIRWQH